MIFPNVLDRPQIVTRRLNNEIAIAEFDRWAEDLEQNFLNFMTRRLEAQLKNVVLSKHPWPRYRELDYQVRIEVLRFDGEIYGPAELSGTWSLVDGNGKKELQRIPFKLTSESSGPGYQKLVTTLGNLALDLSAQIAQVVGRHAGKRN